MHSLLEPENRVPDPHPFLRNLFSVAGFPEGVVDTYAQLCGEVTQFVVKDLRARAQESKKGLLVAGIGGPFVELARFWPSARFLVYLIGLGKDLRIGVHVVETGALESQVPRRVGRQPASVRHL